MTRHRTASSGSVLREDALEAPVREVLVEQGYVVAPQVRILGKTIDLVGAKHPAPDLVTVELKIRDWQRAVRQAYLNQAFAEAAYIAVHERFSCRVALNLLETMGIGLISVGESAEIVLQAGDGNSANRQLAAQLWSVVMGEQDDVRKP